MNNHGARPPMSSNTTHFTFDSDDHSNRSTTPVPHEVPEDRFQRMLVTFSKQTINHMLAPTNVNAHTMKGFYDAVSNAMDVAGLPINPLDALRQKGTTCPTTHPFSQRQIEIVNRHLHQRLLGILPDDCTKITQIVTFFGMTHDGYGALFALMREYCEYLRDLQPLWGPTWNSTDTGYTYSANLQSKIMADGQFNRRYSRREIAAEILQQAAQHPKYQTCAEFQLSRLRGIPEDKDLDDEYSIPRLITLLEQSIPMQHRQPTINKLEEAAPTIYKVQRRFQYRRKCQCRICMNFGHDVDEDTCRIAAQIYFVNQFSQNNMPVLEEQAKKYRMANSMATVNTVRQGTDTDDEYLRKREVFATQFLKDHES